MGEQTLSLFMISVCSDMCLSPKTIYVYLWSHQDTSNNQRKVLSYFMEICFIKFDLSEIENFESVERAVADKS